MSGCQMTLFGVPQATVDALEQRLRILEAGNRSLLRENALLQAAKPALETLRAIVRAGRDEGCTCPACDQYCKTYSRLLNATMAACLCGLARVSTQGLDFVRIADIPYGTADARTAGGEFAKLVHWDLIRARTNDTDQKRMSGQWCLTPKGLAFARGDIQVPRRVVLYNNQVIGFSEDTVDVQGALGTEFDYADLMNRSRRIP